MNGEHCKPRNFGHKPRVKFAPGPFFGGLITIKMI